MKKRRALVVPAALVAGALVAQALATAVPAAAATVRIASPTGTGTACSAAAPCSLETAVNTAPANTEIAVAPGTYSLAAPLTSNVGGLFIHGAVGQARPVLNSTAPRAIDIGEGGFGTRIADLTIVHTGDQYGINVFAKSTLIERVEVRSNGAVACSPGISGLLRDSLCVTSAANGIAVDDSWSGDLDRKTLNLRNVTAVATGPASYGIRADAAGDNTELFIDARNVIASGTAADIRSTETGNRSESRVFVQTSNFDTVDETGGGDVGPTDFYGNQTTPPVFAETLTYRQAPTSPTVDKGGTSGELGSFDLDGQARIGGTNPDIGVDELDTTPPDTAIVKPTKKKLRKRKVKFQFTASEPATFVCAVDKLPSVPCAATYKKKMKRYGKHTITVTAIDVVGNVDPTPAVLEFKVKKKKKKKRKGGR